MRTRPTHVVVGAGLAGARAVEALREEGFDGRVVLLGAEDERPYERPPLSKQYLRGETGAEELSVHAERFYAEHDVELRTGTEVTALDVRASEVVLAGGERLRFDRALLATGSVPRRLRVPGADLDGVLYLRDRRDADAIRERARPGSRVVVVGAGWIGAEVAASLRDLGLEVVVIEPASVPLERALGPRVGRVYRDLHAEHGVELLMGTGVAALEGERTVARVVASDGRRLECDLVVVGIGVTARTGLAEAAGLELAGGGVAVDERLRTSAPNVFAAGDVASAVHPFYGRRVRVEHWANALHQGPAAARAMLREPVAYDRLPYFFSDQYDVGMEYTGFAPEWDEVVVRGDVESRRFVAFWLADGRVAAGMNVGVWDVTDAIGALIRSRKPVDPRALADPDVGLDELVPGPAEEAAR